MSISLHELRDILFFLHIPKTGGTTLEHCIYDTCLSQDSVSNKCEFFHSGIYYYPFEFFWDDNFKLPHSSIRTLLRDDLRAVMGHFFFGLHRRVTRPATYVTLLREPVERVVSLYWHCWQEGRPGDLEEFMLRGLRETDNDQTRRISGISPPFGECTVEMLERAKCNLTQHFSVVGTTEKFHETLVLLQRYLRWNEAPVYLPRVVNLNRTKGDAPKPHEICLIAKQNEFDLALYKFAENLLKKKISEEGPAFDRNLEEFRSRQAAFLRRYPPNSWPNHISARGGG